MLSNDCRIDPAVPCESHKAGMSDSPSQKSVRSVSVQLPHVSQTIYRWTFTALLEGVASWRELTGTLLARKIGVQSLLPVEPSRIADGLIPSDTWDQGASKF